MKLEHPRWSIGAPSRPSWTHCGLERRRPRRPSLERRDDIFDIGEFFQALARDLDHLGAGIEGDDAIAQRRDRRVAWPVPQPTSRIASSGRSPTIETKFVAERGGITRPCGTVEARRLIEGEALLHSPYSSV